MKGETMICQRCGAEIPRRGRAQKYCPECSKIMKKATRHKEATAKSEREYDTALQFRQAIGQQIAKLKARAEAAEARCKLAEKCFDNSALHACETQLELEKKARAKAEARTGKAEKCIAEIEEALKFGRYSAAMLRIFEYRGQKEG